MLPLVPCWLQIKPQGTDIAAMCLKGTNTPPPPPRTQLQITWSISVGTKWLWGNIRIQNAWVWDAFLTVIFQFLSVRKRTKGLPQGSLNLSIRWNVADECLQQEGTLLVSVPQDPFADVSGEYCPAVVGRCGKTTDTSVRNGDGDKAGRKTADRLAWRWVVKGVDGEDKKCVCCRGGEGRLRSSQKSRVVELMSQGSGTVYSGQERNKIASTEARKRAGWLSHRIKEGLDMWFSWERVRKGWIFPRCERKMWLPRLLMQLPESLRKPSKRSGKAASFQG